MPRKTRDEIEAEVAALRALVPVGQYADRVRSRISGTIDELVDGVDSTSEAFDERSDDEQIAIFAARRWARGDCDILPPSERIRIDDDVEVLPPY